MFFSQQHHRGGGDGSACSNGIDSPNTPLSSKSLPHSLDSTPTSTATSTPVTPSPGRRRRRLNMEFESPVHWSQTHAIDGESDDDYGDELEEEEDRFLAQKGRLLFPSSEEEGSPHRGEWRHMESLYASDNGNDKPNVLLMGTPLSTASPERKTRRRGRYDQGGQNDGHGEDTVIRAASPERTRHHDRHKESISPSAMKAVTPLRKSQSRFVDMSPRVVHDGQRVQNVDDLIQVINSAWYEQKQINMVNMKLNCVNLFANFATVFRMNRLRVQCDDFSRQIEDNKLTVSTLRGTVDEQNRNINELNGQVTTLNTGMEEQKRTLQEVNDKYYTSISEMQSTLSLHRKIINKLEHARMREDFALDALLAFTSFWLVNTRFVNLPLRFIFRLVFGRRAARRPPKQVWLIGALVKLIMMTILTLRIRRLAIRKGFHGSVGNLSGYLFSAMWYMSGKIANGVLPWRKTRTRSYGDDGNDNITISSEANPSNGGGTTTPRLLLPQ